jgi:hypothetical protein
VPKKTRGRKNQKSEKDQKNEKYSITFLDSLRWLMFRTPAGIVFPIMALLHHSSVSREAI